MRCIERLRRIFYDRTGITFDHKRHFFAIKILGFMQAKGIDTCDELIERIDSGSLLDELTQELVVSQSYFFREEQDFAFLLHDIRSRPTFGLKILSIPCASGEEPYTLAMFLLKSGIANFSILGVDINRAAIAKAQRGVYDRRTVKRVPQEYRDTFFEPCSEGYAIKGVVKDCVDFRTKNLFAKDFEELGRFDYIFCRNLFIYLDANFKERALQTFWRMLDCEGVLITSFSDYFAKAPGFDTIVYQNKHYYKKRCDEKGCMYTQWWNG